MEAQHKRFQSGGSGQKTAMEFDKKKGGDKRQTRVKVVIRVRPPLTADSKTCVETLGNKVEIFNHRNIRENLQYQFSLVFDKTSKQRDLFEACVRPLLGHAVNGENVSIFAYGPTGAGKTHTMLGTEDDPGMIPRVIHTLFQNLSSSAAPGDHRVTFSFLEIYNEKVQDLLNPSETDLPIREDGCHNIFVAGLKEETITSFDDFKNLFGPALNNRTIAATKLNDRSSRSHCIVQLKVDTRRDGKVFHGKIYLIDLAGSEDNRRTGNSGIRLKESGAINKWSLFVLGEVVDAINNNLPRIPYRNSKLTRLLQDSIGGSCHSVMITNVAPEESYYYDTYCTLNFATKSRKIVNSNVASVSFEKPPEAPKAVKRSISDTQLPGTKNKKPKLSSSANSVDSSTDAVVPLVQRQEHLEKTVKGCMQRMEDLVHQINVKSTTNAKSTKPDSAMTEIQKQLAEVQAQLKEMQRHQEQKQTGAEQKSQETVVQAIPERRRSLRKSLSNIPSLDSILKDRTNKGQNQKLKPTKGHKPNSWMDEDPSCSPLFVKLPGGDDDDSQRFTKGFKSTACKGSAAVPTTPHKFKTEAAKFSNQQKKQNEEFLHILNTASVKQLQELHTVGVKRARLLFDYRQAHGDFLSFDDLRQIPGFTEKYVHSLLQRNLIVADV